MVDVNDIYGSGTGDFLNVENARENKIINKWLTITSAEAKERTEKDFNTGEESEVTKIELSFKEIDFELRLNKTNARRLSEDISPESDNWVGKPIKLRVHTWPNNKEGIVIKSKKELEDDGDEAPKASSSSEPNIFEDVGEVIDMIPCYERVKGISTVLDKQLDGIANKDSITPTKLVRAAQNLMGQGSLDSDQLGQIKEALDV